MGAGPIQSFHIPFDPDGWADLRRRLGDTRWSDAVTSDWSYGTERGFLKWLVGYWAADYDWPARHKALDALPHRRTAIDGFGVHFLHFESREKTGTPILLLNGWPSSFTEFAKLTPLLAEMAPGSDLIVPTLPGFGFSDRPTKPYQVEAAHLFAGLMTALGYERFAVVGTDLGNGVASRMALAYPERVSAIHVSYVAHRPIESPTAAERAAELDYETRATAWRQDEGGYQAIQSSRPQTLAFALADSPAGLASWIVEKFRAWSDCGGDVLTVFPAEALIDNVMIYWITETIGSSIRFYYDGTRLRPPLRTEDYVRAPTAVGLWPHDIPQAGAEIARRLYNLKRVTTFPRGGHFPAWEAPDLYARDIVDFLESEAG